MAEGRKRERQAERAAVRIKDKSAGTGCPHCGAELDGQYEICPVCGHKLVDYCTFCGAPMRPEDIDCPECGMPSEGVVCPSCNIRNHRPFCGQCGQPLSRAARAAVEKAKKDPKVQETARLLMKIQELEAELESAQPDAQEEEQAEPTESEKKFRALMEKVGFTPASAPKPSKRKIGRTRQEIMAEYQQTMEDAAKVMEEMLPPAGATPQEQRNYYTARKVAVMESVQVQWRGIPIQETMGWECNYCHCLHDNPSQCVRPDLGGQWVPCTRCQVVQTGGQIFTSTVEKKVYKRQ